MGCKDSDDEGDDGGVADASHDLVVADLKLPDLKALDGSALLDKSAPEAGLKDLSVLDKKPPELGSPDMGKGSGWSWAWTA